MTHGELGILGEAIFVRRLYPWFRGSVAYEDKFIVGEAKMDEPPLKRF